MTNSSTNYIIGITNFLIADQFANNFLNDNWRLLRDEMVGRMNDQWEPLVRGLANSFFSQVPWNKLYNK